MFAAVLFFNDTIDRLGFLHGLARAFFWQEAGCFGMVGVI